jgi:predicted metal-dependent hydrolase
MELSHDTRLSLERGAALYRAGHHWDAHEAWEEAWQEESGDVRLLLQGLIQIAAAMHKAFVQRQPVSCAKLLGSALGKLDGLAARLGDVDVEGVRADARRALEHAERWSAGAVAAFDPALVPAILVGPLH